MGPLITLCNVVKERTKDRRRKSYHLHLRLSGDGVGLAHCWKVARLVALFNRKDTEGVQAAHVMTTMAEEGRYLWIFTDVCISRRSLPLLGLTNCALRERDLIARRLRRAFFMGSWQLKAESILYWLTSSDPEATRWLTTHTEYARSCSRAPTMSSAQDRGATLLAGVSNGLSRRGPCKGWPLPSPSGGGLNAV